MDEIMLVQKAIKEVSEGKVSEEQAYRLIGMGLLQTEGIRFEYSIQEEEIGRSFWEEHKCEALKIFCEAIRKGLELMEALHIVFKYFLDKFVSWVARGIIYLIIYLIRKYGAPALCELLSKDCEAQPLPPLVP
jgi:hypothetical protein